MQQRFARSTGPRKEPTSGGVPPVDTAESARLEFAESEDPRLLTGRGRYTDDFALLRLAHAFVLRSPYAHARIRSVDIRAAEQMPGVLAVLTGEDWAAEKLGAPGPVIPRQRRDGSPMLVPLRPALSKRSFPFRDFFKSLIKSDFHIGNGRPGSHVLGTPTCCGLLRKRIP